VSLSFRQLLDSSGLSRGGLLATPDWLYTEPWSPTAYCEVLGQFDVERSRRYQPEGGYTFCNLFLTDALSACLARGPQHWAWADGTPAPPYASGHDANGVPEVAGELSANRTHDWMLTHAKAYGWSEEQPHDAQAAADRGQPACFTYRNPSGGHGHTGMVRPSDGRDGIWLWQAGLVNSSDIELEHVFGASALNLPHFWTLTHPGAPP
jgi:hypothetical protein